MVHKHWSGQGVFPVTFSPTTWGLAPGHEHALGAGDYFGARACMFLEPHLPKARL